MDPSLSSLTVSYLNQHASHIAYPSYRLKLRLLVKCLRCHQWSYFRHRTHGLYSVLELKRSYKYDQVLANPTDSKFLIHCLLWTKISHQAYSRVPDSSVFFLLSEFSSQTLTIYTRAGEGMGPSFIPLYHFHLLTNIETFACNFACEMTITYF